MNSNFGSSSDSNWGFSSNSKLEERWTHMRREDKESDEEDEARRNTQYMAAIVAVMVCQPIEEQSQWGDSVTGHSYKPQNRMMMLANLMNNYFNPNLVYTEEDFKCRFL
ncbi:unnamed protein product [Malus baccata var. baccata]